MAGGNTARNEREVAELTKRIVELRDAELSFRDIAAEVGRDVSTVWNHYQRAMRRIPAAAIEKHQENVARRLDEQLRRIDMERELLMEIVSKRHVHISNGHVVSEITGRDDGGYPIYGDPYEDDAPTMAAIDRLSKLDDQEAKLLGMYPKQQLAIERVPSEVDKRVVAMIEAAQRKQDERRAQAAAAREAAGT